nr:DNA-directed DNA polymerase [Tanacetum cinerariifolium]
MQTRSSSRLASNPSSNPTPSTNPNPKGRNRKRSKQKIEDFNLEELSSPIVTMADQRTMAQFLQAPTEGYEDAIVVPAITADNFEIKHGLLTLVQNKQFKDLLRACPHHGFSKLHQLDTFYNALNSKDQDSLNSAAGGNFLDKMPHECLAIIKRKSKVRYSRNKPIVAKVSTNTSTFGISPDVAELKDMVKALLLDKKSQNQYPAFVKAVEESCVTCGGGHSYRNCPATDGNVYLDNIQEFVYQASAVNYNQGNTSYRPPMMSNQIQPPCFPPAPAYQAPAPQTQGVSKEDFLAYVKTNDVVMRNMPTQGQNMQNQLTNLTDLITKFVNSNSASTSSSGTLPSNTIANPRSDLKAITTRSCVSYDRPKIPPLTSLLPKVVENEPEATKDTVNPTNNGSTEDVQPQVVQSESPILTSKPVTSLISEPVIAPVSASKPNPKSSIPYPSRRNDERNREKDNNQIEKFYQIFKDMSFEISFADALILMPKFISTLKALIGNKEKLREMARTPLNEHCSTVLLKKLLEKLGDPGKLLIPCDFPGMAECSALADLGASINLMPFSVWKRLSLPDLTPTCMTLELADRLISRPVRVAEDVYVKVGELTLHVGKEAITFNLDQTSRYSANYTDMTAKQIDVIDMACEEYSQEVLGFSDTISSGNPTPYYDLTVSTTSPTLTPFGNNDFLLEEGDILLLEAFLNDDPSLPPPNQGNYLPEVRKELKICEAKSDKSSVDEPPAVELKDLPPYLEYAFLEGDEKLPVIIAKDLSVEEKTALITVLKSHKRAIAWKLSDIKGIDPEFCTHKILMEEDFEPAVQHQRRVNPKFHDVIKQEVIKLLEAGLIYPISNSPWVSPVHCVPKKGGFIVMENEDNELIPNRLATGWRVCIDYRKLNEATLKDHFPPPFMDPLRNQYYYFLDGFSGTFQRCMMVIFHEMIEKTIKMFMDDFSVFRNSFQSCLSYLERMLKRCEDTNLCLSWEKSHFIVKEGIVLGHKISKQGIEDDKAKVNVITKLPHPTTVKGIRSLLGHDGFYRHFIKDFSKIARPMTRLLEKDTPFIFSQECVEAFQTLKRKLTKAPILITPDWDMPFELMCDVSDYVIGAVIGQRQDKHFRPIHYASKTMTEAESNYTMIEKEMLAAVYSFEKFRSYLIINKSIVYTDHSALKYLFAQKDSKARLLQWRVSGQEIVKILKACHYGPTGVCEIFDVWGIDFMGPFPSSRGNKYIVVAIDYLSKRVEAKALPTNDSRVVYKFLKNLFARFGTPRAIISDRETHFCNDQFTKVMQKYGVTHRLATPYHPQTSGQVEVSNRGLKRILERAVGENRASLSDKLDDAHWEFRTAYKTLIGCTPYKLVYEKACHLPVELEHKAYWALKHANFDLKTAGDHRKVQINELNELRNQAYENDLIYKEKKKAS